jgi:hypothetical protein
MCRSIKPLFNFDPPATDEEIRSASLQFVRKISGMTKPSTANQPAIDEAVNEIASVATRLLDVLQTAAAPKNREVEAERARARSSTRYARSAV